MILMFLSQSTNVIKLLFTKISSYRHIGQEKIVIRVMATKKKFSTQKKLIKVVVVVIFWQKLFFGNFEITISLFLLSLSLSLSLSLTLSLSLSLSHSLSHTLSLSLVSKQMSMIQSWWVNISQMSARL